MDEKVYILLKEFIDILTKLEYKGIICKFKCSNERKPYFKIFDLGDDKNDKK